MTTFSATMQPAQVSTVRRLVTAHPFIAYFLMAYAGTWLFLLPLVLGRDGLGILPYNVPLILYAILFLASAFSGPTLSAFLVTGALEGKAGIRKLFRRYGQWRVEILWLLLSTIGLPLVFLVIVSIVRGAVPWAQLLAHGSTFLTYYLPSILIFPALITWGEEPGWRGFAQTRMQERYHPLLASVVVGLMHGLWHLPIFLLVSGPAAAGPFNLGRFLTNVLIGIMLTVSFTWIFNKAKGSILIAVLSHASDNSSQGWIASMVPNIPSAAGYAMWGFYIVFGLVLIAATHGRLGFQSQQAAPTAQN